MKTTFELPDGLVIAAKQQAAAQRRPLRALVEQGLRSVLQEAGRAPAPKRKIRWVVAEGGAPPGATDREAAHEWLRGRR
jgi:hypothetical protein